MGCNKQAITTIDLPEVSYSGVTPTSSDDTLALTWVVPQTGLYQFVLTNLDIKINSGQVEDLDNIEVDDHIRVLPRQNGTFILDAVFVVNDTTNKPILGNESLEIQLNKYDEITWMYKINYEGGTYDYEVESGIIEVYRIVDDALYQIPRYQALTFNKAGECGRCPEVYMDKERDLCFQTVSKTQNTYGSNLITNDDFDSGGTDWTFINMDEDGSIATIFPSDDTYGRVKQVIATNLIAGMQYYVSYNYIVKVDTEPIEEIRVRIAKVSDDTIIYEGSLTEFIKDNDEHNVGNFFEVDSTESYYITIELLSTDPMTATLVGVDDINVRTFEQSPMGIDTLSIKDCNGDEVEIEDHEITAAILDDLSTVKICIPASNFTALSNPVTIILVTEEEVIFESQPISFIDKDLCNYMGLIQINWSDTCKFGCIDYKNLPFDNEFYLKGYHEKASPVKKESIRAAQPDGTLKKVFDFSLSRYSLYIAPQPNFIHDILEKVFEHRDLIIDGEQFYTDEGDIYAVASKGNGYYSGRIDLIKLGSENISTSCCC